MRNIGPYIQWILEKPPECGQSNVTLCDINLSKLLQEESERFHGKYSCAGMNEASW